MIRKDEKTAVIEANRTHATDTGSPEVQIAILSSDGWEEGVARTPCHPFFPSVGACFLAVEPGPGGPDPASSAKRDRALMCGRHQ